MVFPPPRKTGTAEWRWRVRSPSESVAGRGVYWAINVLDAPFPYVCFPHWFPVLLFALLAAAPWIKWRFSVRTLLIATGLVAVILGVAVATN